MTIFRKGLRNIKCYIEEYIYPRDSAGNSIHRAKIVFGLNPT